MAATNDHPWATGPSEILRHALSLLQEDSDTNRRLAMILTDNAVEQMIKTYLGLPKRVSGISVGRKRYSEISESFPAMLDALEELASDKLVGIDLGVIEWYHRLRNQLYHQGFGLTVERDKVEVYAELANVLFKNLFGFPLAAEANDRAALLGRFVELWNRLENVLILHAGTHHLLEMRPGRILEALKFLRHAGALGPDEYGEIMELRKLRNEVVHGQQDYKKVLNKELVGRLEELVKGFEKVEGVDPNRDTA